MLSLYTRCSAWVQYSIESAVVASLTSYIAVFPAYTLAAVPLTIYALLKLLCFALYIEFDRRQSGTLPGVVTQSISFACWVLLLCPFAIVAVQHHAAPMETSFIVLSLIANVFGLCSFALDLAVLCRFVSALRRSDDDAQLGSYRTYINTTQTAI